MADSNHKVTIDAEWFAEIYANANEKYNSNDEKSKKIEELKDELQGSRNCYYECRDELLEVTKERDELKEKLDDAREVSNGFELRLAAAERCIDDIAVAVAEEQDIDEIANIIRAYREQKEAK